MRQRLRISHTRKRSLVGRFFTLSIIRLAFLKMGSAAQSAPMAYENREKESISRLFGAQGLNQGEAWFPTLTKTVWVLSQLHDYVQASQLLLHCDDTVNSKHMRTNFI
jgi:hypothetical protein